MWVIAGARAPRAAEDALRAKAASWSCGHADSDGRLELAASLELIAGRGITRLMVEGGPTLAAALVAADLVDEAVLFHSPKMVGADGIDALDGLPLTALTQSLRQIASDSVGADRRDVFERR